MKSLRNFLRAILWVWSIAAFIGILVWAISSSSTVLLWIVGAIVLSIITWLVYVGLNGDFPD